MFWGEIAVDLEEKFKNISGDTILSAGVIAYLGPFTAVVTYPHFSLTLRKNYAINTNY